MRLAKAFVSGAGRIRRPAEAIAEGVGDAARLADVVEPGAVDWEARHAVASIVFGALTYTGGVAAPFKSFFDASSDFWVERHWRDKIAGSMRAICQDGFTNA